MRQLVVIVAGVAIAVALILFMRSRGGAPARPAPIGSAGTSDKARPVAPTDAAARAIAKPTTTRRLAPEERRQLAQQIESARAARASQQGSAPALPAEQPLTLDELNQALHGELSKAIPFLAKCYGEQHGTVAATQMTLTTDPDYGTVIDTDTITDGDGKPLDPELDACLRETIDTLAMPPLADRPGKLKLQYSFRFD